MWAAGEKENKCTAGRRDIRGSIEWDDRQDKEDGRGRAENEREVGRSKDEQTKYVYIFGVCQNKRRPRGSFSATISMSPSSCSPAFFLLARHLQGPLMREGHLCLSRYSANEKLIKFLRFCRLLAVFKMSEAGVISRQTEF